MKEKHSIRNAAAFQAFIAINAALAILILASLFFPNQALTTASLLVVGLIGTTTYLLGKEGYIPSGQDLRNSTADGRPWWYALSYPGYFIGMFAYRYFAYDEGRHDLVKSLLFASISTALYVAMMGVARRKRRSAA